MIDVRAATPAERTARGRGVGRALLLELCAAAERPGYYKLGDAARE